MCNRGVLVDDIKDIIMIRESGLLAWIGARLIGRPYLFLLQWRCTDNHDFTSAHGPTQPLDECNRCGKLRNKKGG